MSHGPTPHSTAIQKHFRAFIARPDYPCVGAKTALTRGNIQFVMAGDLRSTEFDEHVTAALRQFAVDTDRPEMFVSMVVLFTNTTPLPERVFEEALWERLQAVHALDGSAWDTEVSDDPASPEFAFSAGGKGFFVIGLHPGASRKARRFECPALVFNLHSQFSRLRNEHRFDRISKIIAARDLAFSGSTNPMLTRHGEHSDAPQFSGREVGAGWRCPFHADHASESDDP